MLLPISNKYTSMNKVPWMHIYVIGKWRLEDLRDLSARKHVLAAGVALRLPPHILPLRWSTKPAYKTKVHTTNCFIHTQTQRAQAIVYQHKYWKMLARKRKQWCQGITAAPQPGFAHYLSSGTICDSIFWWDLYSWIPSSWGTLT